MARRKSRRNSSGPPNKHLDRCSCGWGGPEIRQSYIKSRRKWKVYLRKYAEIED